MGSTPRPTAASVQALPKDATLVELRPDVLTIATRECLLPGTRVSLRLGLEGQPLAVELAVEALLVIAKDRAGYQFNARLPLASLSDGDRHLIQLFIVKGRGAPALLPPEGH